MRELSPAIFSPTVSVDGEPWYSPSSVSDFIALPLSPPLSILGTVSSDSLANSDEMWQEIKSPDFDWPEQDLDSAEDTTGLVVNEMYFAENVSFPDTNSYNLGQWNVVPNATGVSGSSSGLNHNTQVSYSPINPSAPLPLSTGLDMAFHTGDPTWSVPGQFDFGTNYQELSVMPLNDDMFSAHVQSEGRVFPDGSGTLDTNLGRFPANEMAGTIHPDYSSSNMGMLTTRLDDGASSRTWPQARQMHSSFVQNEDLYTPGFTEDQPDLVEVARTWQGDTNKDHISRSFSENVPPRPAPVCPVSAATIANPISGPSATRRYVPLAPSPLSTPSISKAAMHPGPTYSVQNLHSQDKHLIIPSSDGSAMVADSASPALANGPSIRLPCSPFSDHNTIHELTARPNSLRPRAASRSQARSTNPQDRQDDDDKEDGRRRNHPLYLEPPHKDGLYRCPFKEDQNCPHGPTKLKCNYDKYIDSHLKPFRCRDRDCVRLEFSSTACLLRHERETHYMHGHGNRPFVCEYPPCERSHPERGFPRRYNLFDHMRRVHRHPGKELEKRGARNPPTGRKRKAPPAAVVAGPSTNKKRPAEASQTQFSASPIDVKSVGITAVNVTVAPAAYTVGGLVSPPMAPTELDYAQVGNAPLVSLAEYEKYNRFKSEKAALAQQLSHIHSPNDQDSLKKIQQGVAELQRIAEGGRKD